jgi:hypothetical protein
MNLRSLLKALEINKPVSKRKTLFEFNLPPGISPDMFMSVEEFVDDSNTENSLPADVHVDRSPVNKESVRRRALRALREAAPKGKRALPMVPNQPIDMQTPGDPRWSRMHGRALPDAELEDYIGDINANRSMYIDPATGEKVSKKFPGAKYVSPKPLATRDKPLIHAGNIVDSSGKLINGEKLKMLIKKRPKEIIKQNAKLAKSSGGNIVIFNLSLPAMMGLVVDESTNEFKIINTCPSAGACKIYCFATKGGYIQYKDVSLSQSQTLNYLVNDWMGFKSDLLDKLNSIMKRYSKKDTDVYLRWHDAGDFFSDKYLALAYQIARECPSVNFYAYTKRVGMATSGEVPENFIFNFSLDAIGSEKELLKKNEEESVGNPEHRYKMAYTVLPEVVPFNQWVKKVKFVKSVKKSGEEVLGTRTVIRSPQALDSLKQAIADKYNLGLDTLLSYDEMMEITPNRENKNKYNVIVMPGDGDVSATRRDVQGTYLLKH